MKKHWYTVCLCVCVCLWHLHILIIFIAFVFDGAKESWIFLLWYTFFWEEKPWSWSWWWWWWWKTFSFNFLIVETNDCCLVSIFFLCVEKNQEFFFLFVGSIIIRRSNWFNHSILFFSVLFCLHSSVFLIGSFIFSYIGWLGRCFFVLFLFSFLIFYYLWIIRLQCCCCFFFCIWIDIYPSNISYMLRSNLSGFDQIESECYKYNSLSKILILYWKYNMWFDFDDDDILLAILVQNKKKQNKNRFSFCL